MEPSPAGPVVGAPDAVEGADAGHATSETTVNGSAAAATMILLVMLRVVRTRWFGSLRSRRPAV
jgi:hypothetical protein